MEVLYISYDGVAEPLGRSQILPYLKGLAKEGFKFSVLSFEKPFYLNDKIKINELKKELSDNNIIWYPLKYTKHPLILAKLWDIIRGIAVGASIARKKGIKIIHARIFVGALIALILKKLYRKKFLFDIRGAWADERIDRDIWSRAGLLYRIAKWLEKTMLSNCDSAVVLTNKLKNELRSKFLKLSVDINVIPTCVDLEHFSEEGRGNLSWGAPSLVGRVNLKDKFVLVYAGSLGTVYMIKEMFQFFSHLKAKFNNAYFLILASTGKEYAFEEAQKQNVSNEDFEVLSVEYSEMPQQLKNAKAAIVFCRPTYSLMGSCPTKIGEYLASGVPVVINRGIGDCDEIVQEKVGVVLDDFSVGSYEKAVDKIEEILQNGDLAREACKQTAREYFSLESGVERYLKIYRYLI